jgi:hypothetical protein
MAGSGGGGVFSGRTPEELSDLVRKAEAETSVEAFRADLSATLGQLLSGFNGRDTELTNERLADIKSILEGTIEGTFDQLFGGSVAKHTYVDGLSDIDALLLIDKTELLGSTPERALEELTQTLRRGIGNAANVTHGRMAVTVEYPDGMQIQLLPAVRSNEGFKIPSSRRDGWSHIEPRGFQEKLTSLNRALEGKLVPTIKLAKAVIANLPEQFRVSGYHAEALAISAFRRYGAERSTATMLPMYFERAKDLVLGPIKDSTDQSIHVDDYLGPAGSPSRVSISHIFSRIAKRMRNASAGRSKEQWMDLFETPE